MPRPTLTADEEPTEVAPDTPSPHELARDQVQIEKRLDREYEQLTRKMDDGFARVDQQFKRVDSQFADLKQTIEAQQTVPMTLFEAEQTRRDEQHDQLARKVADNRAELERSRTQGVWALVAVIAAAALAQILGLA